MKTAIRELEGVTATATPGVLGFSELLRASDFASLKPPRTSRGAASMRLPNPERTCRGYRPILRE